MRAVALMLSLVVAATAARADEHGDALRLRRAGQIMTGVGLGATVAGVALVGAGFGIPSCAFAIGAPEEGPCGNGGTTGHEGAATGLFFAGIGISVVGDALWIAGASIWSVGSRRARRPQRATAAR